MIGSMSRIIIFVGDVPKLAAWYHEVLGLSLISSPGDDAEIWQELDAGGCRLALHQAYGPNGPAKQATGSPMNPHTTVFRVADVRFAYEKLKAKGVDLDEPRSVGGLVLCNGRDPEGHVFQLSNR